MIFVGAAQQTAGILHMHVRMAGSYQPTVNEIKSWMDYLHFRSAPVLDVNKCIMHRRYKERVT